MKHKLPLLLPLHAGDQRAAGSPLMGWGGGSWWLAGISGGHAQGPQAAEGAGAHGAVLAAPRLMLLAASSS